MRDLSEAREPVQRDISDLAVAYVTRGLAHYRAPVMEALASRVSRLLVIVAGHLGEGFIEGEPSTSYETRVLRRAMPSWRRDVIRTLGAMRPDVILLEHGSSLDFTWTLLLTRRVRPVPRVVWTHGIERREVHTKQRDFSSVGRWMQLVLADGILTYEDETAKRLSRVFPNKVVRAAPNSTDGVGILAARHRLAKEGKDAVKRRLGLQREFYVVGLGRLIAEKEFHRAIPILGSLRAGGLNVGGILIGDGPEMTRIRALARDAQLEEGSDIVFTGGVRDSDELAQWLFCADVCVNPGYLGLSVVDCLFGGVPVVSVASSRSGPFHSPEWKYLQRGVTGWLTERNDDAALTAELQRYLHLSTARRAAAQLACIRYAETNLGVRPMMLGLEAMFRSLDA